MESLYANNETVHNNSSNQPSSAESSHSPCVQYETVARHQQHESIVDTGYEQLTAQYEAVHNNTPEHIDDVAAQVVQLEGRPTVGRWVNNVDENGYSQVLCDDQSLPFDDEEQCQVLNGNELALSELSVECNQRVQQAASVDSYGYLHPVGNSNSDAKVLGLPLASVYNIIAITADPDTGNQLNSPYTAQDQGDTPPNPLYIAQCDTPPNPLYTTQDDTPPNPLYTTQDDTPPNPLYTTQDDTPPNPLYTTQDDTPPNPLYTTQDDTPPNPLYTTQDDTPPNPQYTTQDDTPPNPLYTTQDDTPPNPLYTTQDDTPPNPLYTAQDDTPPNSLHAVPNHENRPRLPTPRNNSQPTSDITFFNSKLPPQLRPSRYVLNGYLDLTLLSWLQDFHICV
jgi:hypothetical protein